jgi:hypothetical protein
MPTPQERIALVARYLHLRSPLTDAAFAIDYHDNSAGLVPGPSDWRIWAALRLPSGAMPSWLEEAHPCVQKPDIELDKVVPATWQVTSEAQCFQRDQSTLMVHAPENVLVFFTEAH